MSEKKRIYWIDIAKAICIFAVIIGHRGIDSFGFVYSFHLTVFFILAGYTSKVKKIDGSLLKNWFNQLMGPYFLTCFAVLIMELFNLIVINRNFAIASVTNLIAVDLKRFFFASGGIMNLGNIDMGRFIGAIWFLPAMFFARVIFQLIVNKVNDKRIQIMLSISVAMVSVMISKVVWLPFSILPGMFAIPFILVGYYVKETNFIERMKLPHYLFCAILFLGGCFTGYAQPFYMVNVYAKDYFLTPVFALAGSFVVIGISRLLEKAPTKALRFFGENSLIVLCVHLVEMNTFYYFYGKIIELLHLPNNKLTKLALEFIVVITFSIAIVYIKTSIANRKISTVVSKRDMTIDIMRGFLIILMIICHSPTSTTFHRIVYSFHMIAFIIISGYFYKSDLPFGVQLKKCLKSLVYYGVFAILYLFASNKEFFDTIKDILGGISYTNKLFTSFGSVGPVYFILLLFAVRFIYIFIDHFFKGYLKDIVVIAVSMLGIFLGKAGFYLFWSIDCAMFCVLFFHLSVYLRKYNILKKLNDMPYLYFALSVCWFLFIYNGSMDLATRRYENVGILIVGAVSAFLLIYQLCSYIMRHCSAKVTKIIACIGESTAYILIFHTLFSSKVSAFVINTLSLNNKNIFYFAVNTFIQVFVGVITNLIVKYISQLIKDNKNKKSLLNSKV